MLRYKLSSYIIPIILITISIIGYRSFHDVDEEDAGYSTTLKKNIEQDNINKEQSIRQMLEFQFDRLRNPKTETLPKDFRRNELKFAKTLPIAKREKVSKGGNVVTTSSWLSEGPINQGGRTKAIVADISNENILLAAAAAGGIWRSTDNGNVWKNTLSTSYIQNVTALLQDTRPGRTNIWYAGTGEFRSNTYFGLLGDGIFKSTDNGLTWNPIVGTQVNNPESLIENFQIVWNLDMDKTTGAIYAAVAYGIYASHDDGNSWYLYLNGSNIYTSVSVNKNGRVYAALSSNESDGGGIFYSDNGSAWTSITPPDWPMEVNRIATAVSESNPNILYVIANTPAVGQPGAETDGLDGYCTLWKYDASVEQWTNLSHNLPTFSPPVGGYTVQGGYDMCIKVKPDDENFVIIGGTNLYRTTDGFASKLTSADWIGGYSTENNIKMYENHHPDQHNIFFLHSNPNIVFSANDGGVHKSLDITAEIVEWVSLNSGYVTTQFWNVALDKSDVNSPYILGGMQDNGTMLDNSAFSPSAWETISGGDGTFCAISDGGQFIYTSSQNGKVYKIKLDDEWTVVTPAGASNFLFVTPYILDPNNTNSMYILAGNKVWRNSDLTQIPLFSRDPTDINWSALDGSVEASQATALAMSKAANNLLYVGDRSGNLYKIWDASDMSSEFIDITGADFPSGYISTIAVDPTNGDNVLVGFSNYGILSLFFSSNGGAIWTEVGGNLEENPDGSGSGPSIRSVKILPVSDGYVYIAATSVGLFTTSNLDGSNTVWELESPDEIGNTVVESLDIRPSDGTVIVGTFGKGIYSSKILITKVDEDNAAPNNYILSQNYPNPFNPTTTIGFTLPTAETVQLSIFNALGEEVAALVNERKEAGEHIIIFNAANLPSGIYLYRLQAGNFSQTKKMLLVK